MLSKHWILQQKGTLETGESNLHFSDEKIENPKGYVTSLRSWNRCGESQDCSAGRVWAWHLIRLGVKYSCVMWAGHSPSLPFLSGPHLLGTWRELSDMVQWSDVCGASILPDLEVVVIVINGTQESWLPVQHHATLNMFRTESPSMYFSLDYKAFLACPNITAFISSTCSLHKYLLSTHCHVLDAVSAAGGPGGTRSPSLHGASTLQGKTPPYLWAEELQPLCFHSLLESAVSCHCSKELPGAYSYWRMPTLNCAWVTKLWVFLASACGMLY